MPKRFSIKSSSILPRCYPNVQPRNEVDLVNQRTAAYNLDHKLSIRFYLRIIFHLLNADCANSFSVYNMTHLNEFTLLDFKAIVSPYLVGCSTSRSRAPPKNKIESKRKYWYQYELSNLLFHLLEFQHDRKRCAHCYREDFDRKRLRSVFLYLVKERNCFLKHHP